MKYVQPIGAAEGAAYYDAIPETGVEGAPVPAAAIEHPQREIEAVISGVGMVPSAGDLTQLRQAITKMIQSGQRSVIINGAVFAGAVTGTGKAVYWDSANSRFDLALADGSAKQNCVGFADVANANVYAFGDAVLFAGLTPGSRYYLDGTTAGAITPTAPTNAVFVGIARNATELFVDVDAQAGGVSAGIQGASRNLIGSATGLSALATYSIDEFTTGDGAGNFQTLRAWAGSITMTTLGTNGLDVGAVAASTLYYAYAISKPDGTKAFIASLSSTSPSLANAAGYTKWARIGSFRTDGTANKYPMTFKQLGRRITYIVTPGTNITANPVVQSGATGNPGAGTYTAVGIGSYVPPTASRLQFAHMLTGATNNICMIAPNANYGAYGAGTNAPPFCNSTGTSGSYNAALGEFAIESSNIYVASNSGYVAILGYEDNL
jgi:hypothetical protein